MEKLPRLIVVFLTLSFALFCFVGCGSDKTEPDPAPAADAEIPKEVQAVKDKVLDIAEKNAKTLDGKWGDQHVALMKSEQARDYKNYDSMLTTLKDIQKESGAYYVYALVPTTDDKGNPMVDDKPFLITVDASEDPDDWSEAYDWEIQFKEAYEGAPAAARSAWADDDEGKDLCWSAFSPIHDSDGNIVAILGVDFPSPEILDFPEWNRDSDQWNGIEE